MAYVQCMTYGVKEKFDLAYKGVLEILIGVFLYRCLI